MRNVNIIRVVSRNGWTSHIDKYQTTTILALTKVAQPSKVLIASGWVTGVGNGITDTEIIDLFDQQTKPMFVILMTTH